MLQSAFASLVLISPLCRFHVQTASPRVYACAKHVSSSSSILGFCRFLSYFRTSIPTTVASGFPFSSSVPWSTKVLLSRTRSVEIRSQCGFCNQASANDTSTKVNLGVDGKQPDSWPSYSADWSKQELLMCTCHGVFDHLPEGATVIATYIDTAVSIHKSQKSQMPTALVVPSGMRDNVELKPLLELMVQNGWRVVIPDVIGSGNTRGLSDVDTGCFTYRFSEKTSFIVDFMHAADICRVDLAIGHGFGCLSLVILGGSCKLFGSVALIAPFPGHKPSRLLEPLWLTVRLLLWLDQRLKRYLSWLWLTRVWKPKVIEWFGLETTPDLVHLLRLFTFLHSINYDAVQSSAQMFTHFQVPLLYVYSDADKFIDSRLSAEFAEMFGAGADTTDVYDNQCQPAEICSKTGDDGSAHYVKAVKLGCHNVSQMEQPVANIVIQELKQLYRRRLRL